MGEFVEYLLRTEHMLIMLGVWVGISTAKRLWPSLADDPTWVRLLPVTPIVLCSAIVWVPGLVGGSTVEKLLLGLVLGAFSGHAHKVLSQTVFGNDKRIRDHPPRL